MIAEEELLADLTPPQRQAVTHIDGPLLVLAGAGSGKTRVITRRVGYLIQQGISPGAIVAITFTNKAADEMSRRVGELLEMKSGSMPMVSTFHSFCALMLRIYGTAIGLETNFTIFDTGDTAKLIRNACGDTGALPTGLTPAKIGEFISRAKMQMIKPEEVSSRLELPQFQASSLARIYKRYEEMLLENRALDFDDLLLKALDLLNNDAAREVIHRRYQYLLIDEYQDTNHVQYLLAKRLSEHTRNICATGDPDQSIYGWRGAEINNILDFEKDFPDAAVVFLENNYRSTEYILTAANSLISNNKLRKEKKLLAVLEKGVKIQIHSCDDENEEAKTLADLINQAQKRGSKLKDIAVMCRINSLFRIVEQTLRTREIPYQLARGVSFFQRREIRDIMSYLRVLVNPADQVALERIVNTPTRGIGAQAQAALKDFAQQNQISLYQAILQAEKIMTLGKSQTNVIRFGEMMEQFRQRLTPTSATEDIVRHVTDTSGLRTYYKQIAQKEHRTDELSPEANLDEFIGMAQKFHQELPDGSMMDFLSQQSLVSDTDAINNQTDCVTLLTMHAAKGLEFEQVIILAAEEDIIPHMFCSGDERKIEEERRLFFVAMTRAKKFLNICYAHHRATRGSYRPTAPSRFIKELDPQTVEGLDVTELSKPVRTNQFIISPRKPAVEASVPTPAKPRCQYRPGQRVYHEKFGYGVIQEIYLSGANYLGTVNFHTGGLKKLVLNIAPLQTVKTDQ
ncbi:MAG: UvrD-helicase domain-containing protein [Phycisphaerae bacterium]